MRLFQNGEKKIVQQMTAGHVDVDAIKSRFPCAHGGAGKFVYDLLDFFDRKRMRRLRVKIPFKLKADGGRADRGAVIHRLGRKRQFHLPRPVVVHLHECRTAVLVNNGRQFAQALDVLVVINSIALLPAHPPRIINRRRLHDKKANASPGYALIKCQDLGSHMNIILMPHQHASA